MTHPRRAVTCACCGTRGEHIAHGWIRACYRRWTQAGKPDSGPPARKRAAPTPRTPAVPSVHTSDIPDRADWTNEQKRLAHHIAHRSTGRSDRALLLEAAGLAAIGTWTQAGAA